MSNRTEAAITITHACEWWRRFYRRPVLGKIHAQLAEGAEVTMYSGDLAVSVRITVPPTGEVVSALDGSISGVCTKCGRGYQVRTGPLYLAAADRQGIAVRTEPGYGYIDV